MYTVIKPENACGLAGYIWQTIRGIYHNPGEKYYIDFSNCLYIDNTDSTKLNPWEYYFEQPFLDTYPPQDQITKTVGLIDVPESEFRDVFMVSPTEEHIQNMRNKFHQIINEYIKLKPALQTKIDEFYEQNMKGKKVLGVHLRGTDHPEKKKMADYMDNLRKIFLHFDIMFVTTDEEYRYKFIKSIYDDRVITYNSIKSNSEQALHTDPHTPGSQKRKIGEDVIIEAYLLSKCDFLALGTNSNVNYLTRAINPNIKHVSL
jgi:hypothetical protein